MRLGSVKVMVRVVNGQRVGSWDLWYRVVVKVVEVGGRIGYATMMVADDEGCC
jgi:hypothetical protein